LTKTFKILISENSGLYYKYLTNVEYY